MITNNAILELAEALVLRLAQWRNQQPFTDLTHTNDQVREIIKAQDSVGWAPFCFGTLHKIWSEAQGRHFSALGKRTHGTTWTSKLIRQVWDLQHKLWVHRNSFVHQSGHSVHQHEREALDRAIRMEFIIGRNGLEKEYDGLFRGNVNRLLNHSDTAKMQWLYRVWMGRDRIRAKESLPLWYKEPLAASFMDRARVRRKRKMGIG